MEEIKQKDFESFYKSKLVPELKELEILRKKFAKKYILVLVVVFLIPGAMALYAYTTSAYGLKLYYAAAGVFLIGIVGVAFYLRHFKKKYVPQFKDKIIRKMISFLDEGLSYHPKGKIERSNYLKSNIYPKNPDRYRGEDLVTGKVGSTPIAFSELHTQYKTKSRDSKGNKKTKWHTIFKGIFFEADFNKHFTTDTYVLADVMEKTFGFIGKKLQSLNVTRPPLVKLENPEFEKHFAVYSNDQVEARYILSTSLMERLTRFREEAGKAVSLSFVDNSIFIALPEKKNLFEPRILRSNLNPDFIYEYHNYLNLCIGIVDDLNLNNRIWTKR